MVLMLIGIAILFYATLTFYYLATQKPALSEIIFLSVFLGVVDIVFITAFVYFSGGIESPYFVLYLLVLSTVLVSSPYYPQAVFLWTAFAALFYDAMVLLTMFDLIPFYSRSAEVTALGPQYVRISQMSLLLIPLLLFFFSFWTYTVMKLLQRERGELETEVESEKKYEKMLAAFTAVLWVLTHVFRLDTMLGKALDKLLGALGLSSGLVLLVDKQNKLVCLAEQGVPPVVVDIFHGKNARQAEVTPANLKGILFGEDVIRNLAVKKIVFRQKQLGILVLFGKEGEEWWVPKFEAQLASVTDEMGVAINYGKMFRQLKRV
jgi:hypothetical protein